MTANSDAIAVRITRLNNALLGGRAYGVSSALSESVNREGLLDALCLLYNECDKEALRKRDKNIAEFVNKYRSVVEETQNLRVNVKDFSVRTLIGKGYFGNVYLVMEKQTCDMYAMKKIRKSVLTTSQIREERDIMSKRCSEWITNLQYAFQDHEHLYLVMEYLPGGDLLSLMSRHGPFDEQLSKFYLAELTLAINALHTMGYVHRDIKPENILIDRFGHIKLGDFGNAAALDRDGHVFSLSPVGTPDYIAPELLQTISTYKLSKNMHDVSCDFWSMGIIGYELICEVTPFHEDNVHETYSKILSHCEESRVKEIIAFPSEIKLSVNYRNLIESLVTSPSKRLNYEGIRKHPFFENTKWDSLRCEVPPIIPTLQSDDDTSNFEDVQRKKTKVIDQNAKKNLKSTLNSSEFCGKDLPFIGYSFVHMDLQKTEHGALEDARYAKLNNKLKEEQAKHRERLNEITKLKQEILRAELKAKQSNTQSRALDDAKEEIIKMKNIIKEKNNELANWRTQIKTLQSSLKIEQEMWEKKETTITELLRLNRQKYDEAKTASDAAYEKRIMEKKMEIAAINTKLDEREAELAAKIEECTHLHEKMDNYKEMLRQHKEQAQKDREEYEKNKSSLSDLYEQKLAELRAKLRHEKDHKSRLTMELRDVRTELDDTLISTRSSEEAKLASAKTNDDILRRLNKEIEANNELHKLNSEFQYKLSEFQKNIEQLQQENTRLERELQVAECGKNLAKSELAAEASPFETAPGSLSDIRMIEEQLRVDLEVAKENENTQKVRADNLQEIVKKLEEMLERFNEQSLSPTKPMPAPRTGNTHLAAGDVLEKQNERLEDKLAAVREQMIVERQSARSANLALWKVEKQLEEVISEKKMTQRRMELTEDRIKKIQAERDDAKRLQKLSEEAIIQREERIEELKQEITNLKAEVLKEHRMWETAEQERMECKSEIIDHISHSKQLEERLLEAKQKLQQCQQKCDKLYLENARLIKDINEEKEHYSVAQDLLSAKQIELKSLRENYERLKYACTVTDNQLSEVEVMLEKEQKCNKGLQEKLEKLHSQFREKEEKEFDIKKKLKSEQILKQSAESKISALSKEIEEQRTYVEEMQTKISNQQQHLMEQTAALFTAQEKVEVLQNENQSVQTLNDNLGSELLLLKEENARILSDLFHAKEEGQSLQERLNEELDLKSELQGENQDLKKILEEKENFYLQRDIKSEATLAQHKKLIDYLQLKVEDLTQKKKKTLADKIFGHHSSAVTNKKENLNPYNIENSILYRTLQEELKRERLRCKVLQEQLDKCQEQGASTLRSPLKGRENTNTIPIAQSSPSKKQNSPQINMECKDSTLSDCNKNKNITSTAAMSKHIQSHHRFELSLQESSIGASSCVACKNPIVAGAPYWKCRECKDAAHRKCRGDVKEACGGIGSILSNEGNEITSLKSLKSLGSEPSAPKETDTEADSVSKYSYEGKIDEPDGGTTESFLTHNKTIVYTTPTSQNTPSLEVACAYEIEENKILLLGCNNGLYALHIESNNLVHIAGIEGVICIAISQPLAKAIMVGRLGESLYQCDLRHLQSRCHSSACLKPVLEASVLELPFANRASTEKWQLVQISEESEKPLDTVAIAATSSRIVILKYDAKQQKFKPVRALDTATSVSSILFTRHSAIVTSDKFFEIDLSTYGAEEFVDLSDKTLSHTYNYTPVSALRIAKHEFLLCFMEIGVFVDEYGCRSRPYDINWEYTPCGFLYRAPFLYIAHFQSIQIIRLHRSYSQELRSNAPKNCNTDVEDSCTPDFKRSYLPFYMPTLLTDSGRYNAFVLAIQKATGIQDIHFLDAMQIFRQEHSDSLETLSSVGTSITLGSLSTNN
ncbi:citron rho-interacting kinase [Stomoxys calcitrans]|uniref:non-specific serine/threonine protein kinase n=1 Tax=Stomoxys calcitrans TaxID=35570 RepID=A0A1I8PSJ6_STOCA|nr:citron rho-interacting kinase [Stomoxys calcitrans]